MRQTILRCAGAALAAATLAMNAGCNGQVAAEPTDGGPQDAPYPETGPGLDTGLPGHADAAPFDAGPPPGDDCADASCATPPPPPPPDSGTAASPSPHNYALHKLYMGDTTRSGVSSTTAWEGYGYNLDNLITTETSTNVCTLAAGAARSTQVDGIGGIDNSFGSQIMPILITVAGSDYSDELNAEIQSGTFTDLFPVFGFDDTAGNATNATGLNSVLLGGGDYPAFYGGGAPAWDLSTHWPIQPETLKNCPAGVCPAGTDPITAASVVFPNAYQANGTFVSGTPADISMNITVGGQTLTLAVHAALVTFQPEAPGQVTNGIIAGALLSTQLVSSFQAIAGSISTSLCSGSAFASIAQELTQASDIVLTPPGAVTNQAGIACNAISIGLGFDATEIAMPTSADIEGPTPAPPDPCGPDQ